MMGDIPSPRGESAAGRLVGRRDPGRGRDGAASWAAGPDDPSGRTASDDWLQLCQDYFQRGAFREAEFVAARALDRHPDAGRIWEARGLALLRLGRPEPACEALETAQALVPLTAVARCALADCHARAGRPGLACDLYHALAADPACPASLLPTIASGLGALGRDQEALDTCRELARRAPGCHEAQFGQAFYLRRLGASAEVVLPLVARAHELAPAAPLYRVTLGALLTQLGRDDEAYDVLCDVDPAKIRCAGCLRRMSLVFERSGDLARLEACRSHREAREDSQP